MQSFAMHHELNAGFPYVGRYITVHIQSAIYNSGSLLLNVTHKKQSLVIQKYTASFMDTFMALVNAMRL